ncbi:MULTISPECIES: hypothetical protein [Bacillus]|uniref:Uncharacterized protein n=4 Tax=Bacillus cereus group TaxID=86661 RepID=R8NB74_BACCX|nr:MULTISPECIES: hypothetical protein [Bacillus]KXY35646.1 hypothetical protein AT269_17045 [Bacillus cereus]AIW86545.1 putative membrane protein [Bacillus mycoides]EJP94355.1 hypothetical protein IC3_02199 [Bacillus cereus VD142]EJR29459.1 hypothetical protein IIG_03783 [Bacillus cereus VD048]EJR36104.1 hypothetical protein III_04295 [Bacillus mycoides]
MRKFLIPYSHSLLSLFISMTIVQIYDEKGIFEGGLFSIFTNLFIAMANMLAATLIIGIPVVLVGCLLGEILFRCVILPVKLHFIPSLILYILLAISIVFGYEVISDGFPTIYENTRIVVMMYFMGLTVICSITFLVSRTTYEEK